MPRIFLKDYRAIFIRLDGILCYLNYKLIAKSNTKELKENIKMLWIVSKRMESR